MPKKKGLPRVAKPRLGQRAVRAKQHPGSRMDQQILADDQKRKEEARARIQQGPVYEVAPSPPKKKKKTRPTKSERAAARKNPTPPPKPVDPYVGGGINPNVSQRQMGGRTSRISSLSYGGDSIAYRRGQGTKY